MLNKFDSSAAPHHFEVPTLSRCLLCLATIFQTHLHVPRQFTQSEALFWSSFPHLSSGNTVYIFSPEDYLLGAQDPAMQREVALFPCIVGEGENSRDGEGFISGYLLFLPASSFAVRHNDLMYIFISLRMFFILSTWRVLRYFRQEVYFNQDYFFRSFIQFLSDLL